MSKNILFIAICGLILVSNLVFANEVEYTREPDPNRKGMERIKVGPAAYLEVPKGAKVYNDHGFITTETGKEYMGRKGSEWEEELERYKKENIALQAEVTRLNNKIELLEEKKYVGFIAKEERKTDGT